MFPVSAVLSLQSQLDLSAGFHCFFSSYKNTKPMRANLCDQHTKNLIMHLQNAPDLLNGFCNDRKQKEGKKGERIRTLEKTDALIT